MFCIGLTGKIASGKSTVAQLFKKLGAVVISADVAARELTQINQPALAAISQHFGAEVIDPSGELNRKRLRELIFSNPEQRLWLEQLLHPLIREKLQSKLRESSDPYALLEIPLLKERADYPYLDRVLMVLTSKELALERVTHRDQCSREQAEAILAVQADNGFLADDFIDNDGDLATLAKKIEKLHEQYLQFASRKS